MAYSRAVKYVSQREVAESMNVSPR